MPTPTTRTFGFWLAGIAAVAFGVRVVYILTVTRFEDAVYDSFAYVSVAKSLAEGRGFQFLLVGAPDASHAPLTSIVIVPVTWLFGATGQLVPQRLTMAVLGVVVVVAIGLLGRVVAGGRVGLVAAGLAAVYPNLWIGNGIIMPDTLASLAIVVALLLTYRLLRAPSWPVAAAMGVCCGLGALTRGEYVLLVPVLAVPAVLLAAGLTWAARLRLLVVIGLVFTATLTPWVVRNLRTFEEPTFITTGDGILLLGSNCDETYGGDLLGLFTLECAFTVPSSRDQSVESARQRDAALDYIGDHLDRLPVVVAARIGRTWELYRPLQNVRHAATEGRPVGAGWAGLAMYYLLVPLTVAGGVVMHRRKATWWPLWILFGMVTFVVATAHGYVRYRGPAEISMLVLAAVAIVAGWDRWRSRRTPSAPSPTPAEA
jgi:4-amino-4-deoxy-L-arabinose transferase-like glycosyltransferase